MKTVITVVSIMLCISINTYSQAPDTTWIKIFGKNLTDSRAYSVQQTSDDGFIITGYTDVYGAGGYDVWLIRTDSDGDTLWTKAYGGIFWDEGRCVQQTNDGGFIIEGYTKSYGNGGGNADIWLIKTNTTGDTLWTKTYGIFANDFAYSVQQTNNGGYIICGETNNIGTGSNVYLIKTDALGDSIWTKNYGGITHEAGFSVQQTSDGGYINTGVAWEGISNFNRNIWLVKTNQDGDTLWTKSFGNNMKDDWSHSVQQTKDGGYIIAGETTSFGAGGYDIWLIKTNPNGDMLWTKTFGGSLNEYGYSVQQTADEGYIVTGYTESFGAGVFDLWLIKTDSAGDTLWTKTFGGVGADFGYSGQQTSDEGYIFTGFTTSYGLGANKFWLIKLEADPTAIDDLDERVVNDFKVYQNYPNPFNPSTTISWHAPVSGWQTIKLFDVLGREIETIADGYYEAGPHSTLYIANSTLPSGVYFYQLKAGGFVQTKKMILLK